MKTIRAELHVHTVLSPCAEVEMIPPLIVQEAMERGIQLIAVTDHNASANIAAVQRAAQGSGLTVLPGMELQTREEVHLLCLFDTLDQVGAWQARIDRLLPDLANEPEHFGAQFVVDETGDYIRTEERLLLVSADIGLDEAALEVAQMGGLAIPAHVDRRANGLIPLLGLVPVGVPFAGLEISRRLDPIEAQRQYRQIAGYPLLKGGDAHRLEELHGFNRLCVEEPSLSEIALALRAEGGRSLEIGNLGSDNPRAFR